MLKIPGWSDHSSSAGPHRPRSHKALCLPDTGGPSEHIDWLQEGCCCTCHTENPQLPSWILKKLCYSLTTNVIQQTPLNDFCCFLATSLPWPTLTHTYTHLHTHTPTHIPTHLQTCTHTYTHPHMPTHLHPTHTYTHTYTHIYKRAQAIHTHLHPLTPTHLHSYTHTYTTTHTYTHLYTLTHLHTYTHMYLNTRTASIVCVAEGSGD